MFFSINGIAQVEQLEVAAYTFSVQPKIGTPSGHSRTGNKIEEVYGDLKSTLFLFSDGERSFCLLTSPLGIERDRLYYASKEILSQVLKIPSDAIVANSSHNHTIPYLDLNNKVRPEDPTLGLSWDLGQEYVSKLRDAAEFVSKNLQPISLEWGRVEENRITYNRKGIRSDGSTYFMREEDRLDVAGEGYRGNIDPDATVLLFKGREGKVVSALTFFTGHPVAAYNPEKMISYGQFPQAATEKLSVYLGGIPVGFVQGSAGNINSKHMLTGTIDQAKELGEMLGDSFILASNSTVISKRVGLEWSREPVNIPLSELPPLENLKSDLASIDDFIRRGEAGDEDTFECVGMNFPKALSPSYRAKLIDLVRPWYVWAIEQHETNNLGNLPSFMPIRIFVARIGDLGFVGMPYETFVETGLKIKSESILPCVLTCGYTDGRYGYIPDASGVLDREYMSGAYRYMKGMLNIENDISGKEDDYSRRIISANRYIPPYKSPAGDEVANVAIRKVNEFAR